MTVLQALVEHVVSHAPAFANPPSAGYGRLFATDFDLSELLAKQLSGKVFSLDGAGTIQFPSSLAVTAVYDAPSVTWRVSFSPPAEASIKKLITIRANIPGATLRGNTLTVQIAGFPDLTVTLTP